MGYPACAGIDQQGGFHNDEWQGLPRMRGDRPHRLKDLKRKTRATPHARGSTRRSHGLHSGAEGYPACAGIDPSIKTWRRRLGRLPRMRGDRPVSNSVAGHFSEATPHARGSTFHNVRHRLPRRGYPACAGIDPHGCIGRARLRGLPRMRGDRPCICPLYGGYYRATPHARGSTRVGGRGATRGCS